VAAGDKSDPSNGLTDYWMIKFCDSTMSPVALFTAPQYLCPGTCSNFTNLSVGASSYEWIFPGANPSNSSDLNPANICYNAAGTYDVTLIAHGSNGDDTLEFANFITVYPQPPPQSIIQNGDTLSALGGATTYQWYFNGSSITGATDYFYVALQSGNYNVVATDSNGCEVEAAILNVLASAQSSVSVSKGSEQLEVFPNPVSDELYVNSYKLFGTAEAVVSIYNLMGDKVYEGKHFEPMAIDCENFAEGVYYLEVISEEQILQARFVKQ
jgi:PKD repeat protein